MSVETRQSFLQGLNRRFSRRDSVDPSFFWTLQNARLFKRGETGVVKRIKGYERFPVEDDDYDDVLDVISYKDQFIVFCKRDGDFHLDVLDADGEIEFSDSFSGDDTDDGSLLATDQTIYICPHNKMLFHNEDGWTITDYRSESPRIIDVEGEDNETPAEGSIEITSGANGFSGSRSRATLEVQRNNVPEGEEDVFTVKVGSNESSEITVSYQDSLTQIRNKIVDGIKGTDIEDDWEIDIDFSIPSSPHIGFEGSGGNKIFFTAKDTGGTRNSDRISIVGSTFSIIDNDKRFPQYDPKFENQIFGGGDDINVTVRIDQPSGGSNARDNAGPVKLYFRRPSIYVETANVSSNDTASDVADKIEEALDESNSFGRIYTVERTDDKIIIKSIRGGKRYNSKIELTVTLDGRERDADNIFDYDLEDLSGGSDADAEGTLVNDEDYWYRVRYRYLDGHRTQTSFPVHFNTGPNENIVLTVDCSARDLDGGRPEIEIFRKRGSQDFFMIDRLRPDEDAFEYTDDGKHEIDGFIEQQNVWHKAAETHEVVENRYVRAGIQYYSEELEDVDFDVETEEADDTIECPRYCKAHVYIKPQYVDGTTGYHERVGSVQIKDEGKKIKLSQNEELSNSDKDVVDVGVYAKYLPYGEEHIQRFNSPEIANSNISSISDSTRFPDRTRVFFGFKYLLVVTRSEKTLIYAQGWDSSDEDDPEPIEVRYQGGNGSTMKDKLPRKLTVSVFGIGFDYVRHAVKESDEDEGEYYGIYKLDIYEALSEAVKTNQVKVRIAGDRIANLSSRRSQARSRDRDRTTEGGRTGRSIGSTRRGQSDGTSSDPEPVRDILTNDELILTEARVTGLIDRSEDLTEIRLDDVEVGDTTLETLILPPRDCRLYLELEGSAFDEIDNENLNQYNLRRDYSDDDKSRVDIITSTNSRTLRGLMSFELINFALKEEPSFKENTDSTADLDGGREVDEEDYIYYRYRWNYGIYDVPNRELVPDDTLIYLGRKSNEIGSKVFDVTGFENPENDQLNYDILLPYNIYERQIDKETIRHNRLEMPNQLVWSAPLVQGSVTSGGRLVSPENFFDVGPENGDILEISYLNGRLYVFCEKAVAMVNIGDVVTQQREGELSIDTSRFMNAHSWLIDGLSGIQKNSIVRHGGSLWFTDGYEVYRLDGEGGNQPIGQGRIPLDQDNEYSAIVDTINSEYLLSDQTDGKTWAYNYEFDQWQGPFTFTVRKGANYRSIVLSDADGLVQHNVGNTFNGEAYKTKIESVANDDSEASFADKLFRKFYVQTDNDADAVLYYGKSPDDLSQADISDMVNKHGYYHQGIKPKQQNSKVIYWEIDSSSNGFELRDISWTFTPRTRF